MKLEIESLNDKISGIDVSDEIFFYKKVIMSISSSEFFAIAPIDFSVKDMLAFKSAYLVYMLKQLSGEVDLKVTANGIKVKTPDNERNYKANNLRSVVEQNEGLIKRLYKLTFDEEITFKRFDKGVLKGIRQCLESIPITEIHGGLHFANCLKVGKEEIMATDRLRLSVYSYKSKYKNLQIPFALASRILREKCNEYATHKGLCFFRNRSNGMLIGMRKVDVDFPDYREIMAGLKGEKGVQLKFPSGLLAVTKEISPVTDKFAALQGKLELVIGNKSMEVKGSGEMGEMRTTILCSNKKVKKNIRLNISSSVIQSFVGLTDVAKYYGTKEKLVFEKDKFFHAIQTESLGDR